jgi:hypothetical protein
MRLSRSIRQTTKRSTSHNLLSQHRETKARARRPRRSLTADRWIIDRSTMITAHRKSTEMECVGKTCCAATESAACRKFIYWSWRRDLNPRPPDYKSGALPTELRQQIRGKDAPSRKLIPLIPARCPGQLFKISQAELSVQAGAHSGMGHSRRNQSDTRQPTRVLSFHP